MGFGVSVCFDKGTTGGDVVRLLPLIVGAGALGYYIGKRQGGSGTINKSVDKSNPKVVHIVDIEEVGKKKCFCRCWKSKDFPYCDGSHNAHNVATGDNVAPLIITNKALP